jgi:DNA-binding transcriptional ArsR family regulator
LANGRAWSLRELASELSESRGKVRYHVKVLRELELVERAEAEPRRSSTEHYYIAVAASPSYAADSSLSLRPSPVAIPSPGSQEFVLVRRSEIDRLKRSAKRAFADPAGNASGWAYTWLGIGVGALLSLGGLVGVKHQAVATGVVAGDVALAFIGLFLAGYLLWFDRHADRQSTTETDLVAELDELDRRAPTTVPAD